MSDISDDGSEAGGVRPEATGAAGGGTSRRRLMLGLASASTVVTIRPALAQTAGSVMNCQIPVPDPRLGRDKWIDARGKVVDQGTAGAFRPPLQPLKAADVKRAMQGANFPGAEYEQSRAYMAYIRRLQNGMSGFTCYQSLQMPRP